MATIPTVAEIREILDIGSSRTDAVLQDVLDAELEDQNDLCEYEGDYPARLRQALLRRVNRHLAVAEEPLGLVTGAGDGNVGMPRITGRDREVDRLEMRYWRIGEWIR